MSIFQNYFLKKWGKADTQLQYLHKFSYHIQIYICCIRHNKKWTKVRPFILSQEKANKFKEFQKKLLTNVVVDNVFNNEILKYQMITEKTTTLMMKKTHVSINCKWVLVALCDKTFYCTNRMSSVKILMIVLLRVRF